MRRPLRTLDVRLARCEAASPAHRARLQARLARRGVTLSDGSFAMLLVRYEYTTQVPARVIAVDASRSYFIRVCKRPEQELLRPPFSLS